MIRYRPDRILVEADARQDGITAGILARLEGLPVGTIERAREAVDGLSRSSDPRASGKRTLILARNPGRFLKPCPGSGAEICCNYYVLNLASNCHFECTYCVLQSYLDHPALIVFTNTGDLLKEVEDASSRAPERFFRIGTGELADSLALDDITGYSRELVPFFAGIRNGILELKTKSDRIGNLRGLPHRGRTIVSWSVNARTICETEELKTASLEDRLSAARLCQEWGYRIGFHFDPLIWYENWEQDYRSAVEEIFSSVDTAGIAWVSLGALRFTPRLREIVRARFPKSKVPHGEFVPGHHGKLRYFRPIREEMYAKMVSWIRAIAPRVFVYLCMEDSAAWRCGFGAAPGGTAELSSKMDWLAANQAGV